MLKRDCPCGDEDLWQLEESRRLTSCKQKECNVEFWNNITVSGKFYYRNFISYTRDSSDPELHHTPVVSSENLAKDQTSNNLGKGFSLEEDTCLYPYDAKLSICGDWALKCYSMEMLDMEQAIHITGSAGDPSHGEVRKHCT